MPRKAEAATLAELCAIVGAAGWRNPGKVLT
jgi:hypothetical protein